MPKASIDGAGRMPYWCGPESDFVGRGFCAILCVDSAKTETVDMMAYGILFVDDEDQILALFREVFESTDYSVYTAKDGIDALAQVREKRPDLVFLDIAMPHMRGDEALPLIHAIDPDIAVVVVSGRTSEGAARDLLNVGAFDYIYKPFEIKRLLDVVEHWRKNKEAEGI